MQKRRGIDGIHGQQAYIYSHDDGKGTIKFTQPVIIKNLHEEYKVSDGPVSKMPVVAGQVLMKGDQEGTVSP